MLNKELINFNIEQESAIFFFFNSFFKFLFLLRKNINFQALLDVIKKSKFIKLIIEIFFSFSNFFNDSQIPHINSLLDFLKQSNSDFYNFFFKYQICLALKKSLITDITLINI